MAAADVIKKIRVNSYLSREEFAQKMGVTRQSIANYETGVRKPRLPIIKKMREFAKENGLDIPVEEFLK